MTVATDDYLAKWPDATPLIESHVADGLDRLVVALQGATNLKKMLAIFLEEVQKIEDVMVDIRPSVLFNLTDAIGVQLDQLGALLGLPREGWDDDTYRLYLRTQSLLILPDRRTVENLLTVARTLIDDSVPDIAYSEWTPKSFFLSVEADIDDVALWKQKFFERCRPITYAAYTIWLPEESFGYDDIDSIATTDVEGFSDVDEIVVTGGQYPGYIL